MSTLSTLCMVVESNYHYTWTILVLICMDGFYGDKYEVFSYEDNNSSVLETNMFEDNHG